MQDKICGACKILKTLSQFYKDRSKPDGHGRLCKICHAGKCRLWREKNPERFAANIRRYRNSANGRQKKREWTRTPKAKAYDQRRRSTEEYKAWRRAYERSPEVVAYRKAYKARPARRTIDRESKKTPEKRLYHRDLERRKRLLSKTRVHNAMSCRIRAVIVKGNISWPFLVGYTPDELKIHLEKQFDKRMTWNNYGKYGWHIDHIVPVSHFQFESVSDPDFKACWALSNLRPLSAKQNLAKRAKRTHLI